MQRPRPARQSAKPREVGGALDAPLQPLLRLTLDPRHRFRQALHGDEGIDPLGRPALERYRDRVVDGAPARIVGILLDEPEAAVTLEIALVLLARARGRIRA